MVDDLLEQNLIWANLRKNWTMQEPYQLIHPRLVETAKFLHATKSTNHSMFNPCSLSSGKPFVRLHRTESLIVLYFRNVKYGVFKVLGKSCIDKTLPAQPVDATPSNQLIHKCLS